MKLPHIHSYIPGLLNRRNRESRTLRATLTSVTNLLTQSARIVAQFIVTPILVHGLGNELYGAWRMIQQATEYLSFGDLGGSNTLKWTLAKDISSPDFEAKRRQIGAVMAIWIRVVLILLLIGGTLTALAPWIIEVESIYQTAVIVCTGLMVLNFALSTLVSIPYAVLRGMNLEYRAMVLNAVTITMPALLGACAVLFGLGLIGVAVGQIVGLIIIGLTRWLVARRALPWLGISRPRGGETSRMLRLSIWFFLWTMVRRMLTASDIVIVGLVLSPTAVTGYALTRFMFVALMGPINAVLGSVMPGVGDLVGQGEWTRVASIRRQGLCLAWLMATTAGVLITIFNQPFLDLWVGEGKYAGDLVNVGLVIVGILFIKLRFDANLIDATLDVSRKIMAGAAVAITTVAIGAVLTHAFGLIGMVVALGVGRILLSGYYAILIRTKTGEVKQFWGLESLRPALASAALIGLSWLLSRVMRPYSWPGLIFSCAACSAVTILVFWHLALPSKERGAIITRLRSSLIQLTY